VTRIQEVLFELEADYLGHPYYVTGHALQTAIARRVDGAVGQRLCASMGVFIPGEYGAYPEWHSQSGGVPYMGTGLRPVEAYEDLFLFREPAQRWLSDTRPRDAHNTHPLRRHGGRTGDQSGQRLAFAPDRRFGRPPDARNTKRTVNWYVHCYLHCEGETNGESTHLPLPTDVLDGLQVGGARNYGFGRLSLADTQVIDLPELEYSRLQGADGGYVLEFVSPYVLVSAYPSADDNAVPDWWGPTALSGDRDADTPALRRREACLVVDGDAYPLVTVDHGQVVAYAGGDTLATARNGITRIGTHSKYGFGELRVRPAGDARVVGSERATAGGDGAANRIGDGSDCRGNEATQTAPTSDREGE